MNSLQQFRIIAQHAGKADLAVSITSPSGSKIKAHVIPTHEGYLVNFTPTQLGEHLLGVSFDGMPLSFSPFKITCLNGSYPYKVKAHGPGLHRGFVNRNAEFTIDTRGAGQSGLCVTLEGPCEAPINCRDNGDGTCSVTYLPTKGGDYIVNITFNDEHIPGSPFHAVVVSDVDVNKFRITGNGLNPHGIIQIAVFLVVYLFSSIILSFFVALIVSYLLVPNHESFIVASDYYNFTLTQF